LEAALEVAAVMISIQIVLLSMAKQVNVGEVYAIIPGQGVEDLVQALDLAVPFLQINVLRVKVTAVPVDANPLQNVLPDAWIRV